MAAKHLPTEATHGLQALAYRVNIVQAYHASQRSGSAQAGQSGQASQASQAHRGGSR